MDDVILACNVYSYGGYRERAFEHMQAIGIRYAEVSISKPEDADEWLKQAQPHGIRFSSLICPCDVSTDAGAEEFAGIARAVPNGRADRLHQRARGRSPFAGSISSAPAHWRHRG